MTASSDHDAEIPQPKGAPYTRVRIRIGNAEVELEGSEDFVQRNLDQYLNRLQELANRQEEAALPETTLDYTLPLLALGDEEDTLLYTPDGPLHTSLDDEYTALHRFYPQHQARTRREQLLLIGYFYQHERQYQHLSANDYGLALWTLSKKAVALPRGTLQALLQRNVALGLLRHEGSGEYALTEKGEQVVAAWL